MVFASQFSAFSTMLASSRVYGLGEHMDGLLLDTAWTRYTMWNADQPPTPGVIECKGFFAIKKKLVSVKLGQIRLVRFRFFF